MSHLLPAGVDERDDSSGASIDLGALGEADERFETLARYVDRIQQERGDYNGRVLTLRAEDIRTVAAAIGLEADAFLDDLREASLVVERPYAEVTAVPRPATAL